MILDPRATGHVGPRRLQVGVTQRRRGCKGPRHPSRKQAAVALRVADYEDASAANRARASIDNMVRNSSDRDASDIRHITSRPFRCRRSSGGQIQ